MIDIPVYRPHFTGNEREYVLDCIDSGWISSRGEYINRFEDACRHFIGADYVHSVSNGTVALHLAMLACGISAGDEVIVPTLTYVASVNAIRYVGATPVFVDSLSDTWQIDPEDVERRITPRTKAIMVVHLYGCPCDMSRLCDLAKRHNIKIIEDAAEAFGTRWKGQHVGTFGDVATFSFFGNKTITTGEGGLVVCRDAAMAEHIALLKSQYASTTRRYWHDDIGYNYRMTNVAAAIGLAQVEKVEAILKAKRDLAGWYEKKLAGLPVAFHKEPQGATHSYWMVSILAPSTEDREPLCDHLERLGIETRPFFYPAHTLPMYADPRRPNSAFPIATDLGSRGINLPSFPDLSEEQVDRIADAVRSYFKM
jgi:perosamine synthetase